MITNRFNYHLLDKVNVEGKRYYLSPSQEKLASVTTILDSTKSIESKKALQEWRNRVGHKKAQEITSEASSRGTRMHKWLENHIKKDDMGIPGTNPYSIQSFNMAKTVISQGLTKCSEFWGTEVSLYFPKIYAGTTDLVGVHEGKESIMDFKQTNKLKKREWIEDYFTQVVFYGTAHNEVYGTNIRKGVILMCSAENVYQEFILDGSEWDKHTKIMWDKLEEYYTKLT